MTIVTRSSLLDSIIIILLLLLLLLLLLFIIIIILFIYLFIYLFIFQVVVLAGIERDFLILFWLCSVVSKVFTSIFN